MTTKKVKLTMYIEDHMTKAPMVQTFEVTSSVESMDGGLQFFLDSEVIASFAAGSWACWVVV